LRLGIVKVVVASMNQEQGVLTYKCPDSGRSVRTTIRTSRQTLTGLGVFKISVWCPHCRAPHQITGKDASLTYAMLAEAG
jgi:peptide subunit release factor 1 (eRF1)